MQQRCQTVTLALKTKLTHHFDGESEESAGVGIVEWRHDLNTNKVFEWSKLRRGCWKDASPAATGTMVPGRIRSGRNLTADFQQDPTVEILKRLGRHAPGIPFHHQPPCRLTDAGRETGLG